MFKNRKHKFYYGDGTDNVVLLTDKQALALNSFKFYPVDSPEPNATRIRGYVDLADGCTMKDYSEGADILNKYLVDHTVFYNETDKPMLRPVKSRKK